MKMPVEGTRAAAGARRSKREKELHAFMALSRNACGQHATMVTHSACSIQVQAGGYNDEKNLLCTALLTVSQRRNLFRFKSSSRRTAHPHYLSFRISDISISSPHPVHLVLDRAIESIFCCICWSIANCNWDKISSISHSNTMYMSVSKSHSIS